jgi:hypothetical protein
MRYRRYGLGNSISRGFGLAAGFALFSLTAGANRRRQGRPGLRLFDS